jgi:primosomal protein N' (replication factor Y)
MKEVGRLYAQVIVSNTSHNTDRPFHYSIGPELVGQVGVGSRVTVPFGSANRLVEGYVVAIGNECPDGIENIKGITRVMDKVPLFSEELINLSRWMRDQYLCTWSEALHCIMPASIKQKGYKYVLNGNTPPNGYLYRKEYEFIASVIKKAGGRVEYRHLIELSAKAVNEGTIRRLINDQYLYTRYYMHSGIGPRYQCWVRTLPTNGPTTIPSNATRMKKVLEYLSHIDDVELPCSQVVEETGCSLQTLRSMERRGIIELYDRQIERAPSINTGLIEDRVEELSAQQRNALDGILQMYRSGVREVLLHGVTGSGKTEVYMRLIGEALDRGKRAIVLVPEISLTPQMAEWYIKRFGGRAALFHSRLSAGERYDQWEAMRRGDYDVVIGARSAVFAPFDNIGLIILDEEHEYTYKSESSPRYITRDVARKRCAYYDGLLVLGSATPSIESYHRAKKAEIGIVEMCERVGNSQLPDVEVVDMREELKAGNRSIFSMVLAREIENTLAANRQAILLLNRRGFSTYVCCRDCGKVSKCKNCDISLTYHRAGNRLVCHYCGYTAKVPKTCNDCGSERIKHMGLGTEKLEKELEKTFPGARVLRMDVDTTRKKGAHFKILHSFKNREGDILVGTQMIAKGLDFPGVTLVGVVLADFTLNIPDFRSAEKTFQLLTQVSGRAGRGDIPGKVIVQTYSPGHYSIIASQRHDYAAFYKDEVLIRREFGYPPFARFINIIVTGVNIKDVIKTASDLYSHIRTKLGRSGDGMFEVLGPSPALHSRINGKYRWQLIIKSTEMEIIRDRIRSLWLEAMQKAPKGVNIVIDIDPYNLM